MSIDEVKDTLEEVAGQKNLYVRMAGTKGLSVVTDQFEEIHPVALAAEAKRMLGYAPIVRYVQNNESLQIHGLIK